MAQHQHETTRYPVLERSTSAPALLAQVRNKIDHARRSYVSDLNDLLFSANLKFTANHTLYYVEEGMAKNINANG